MGQLKGTETPEQVATVLIGDSDNVMSQNLRRLVTEAIEADRAARGAVSAIKPPSGLPFDVVSDEAAEKAVDIVRNVESIVTCKGEPMFDTISECHAYIDRLDKTADLFEAVIAHRAHLNKQVTDAQATSTATLLAKRLVDCKVRGVMAWVVGDHNMANPYDVNRDNESWMAWTEGWIMADRADMSSGNAPRRKR